MSISEPFIRRPIATSLMMLGVLVFGIGAYGLLPVAALPKLAVPVLSDLPGLGPLIFGQDMLVYLALAAQYESLFLPLAILLILPMSLLSAITGVWLTGGENNIFTQIGLFVLVGLSAKNAILIVEFARELEFAGHTPLHAAIEAARLRLRPILMTSLAFVMGVVPLAFATGAGSEMRRAMGVAVFSGMLGVTAFGLFLTPVFYVLLRRLSGNRTLKLHGHVPHLEAFAGTPGSAGGGSANPVLAAPLKD